MGEKRGWQFCIDTGGTFTDCLARDPQQVWHRLKVLSSGVLRTRVIGRPGDHAVAIEDAPIHARGALLGFQARQGADEPPAIVTAWDAVARVVRLDRAVRWRTGESVDFGTGEEAPVVAMRLLTGTDAYGSLPPIDLRLATTRGTNALLEGKGAVVAFFTTEGFGDLLRIGDQRRPDLFAIHVEKPPPLHGPVVEVRGRLDAEGRELKPLDLASVRAEATRLLAAGCDVAAVALLHSYRDDRHERRVADVLRQLGFRHVSVSSELAPAIKIVPRAETAVVDAALGPVMEHYLSGVARVVDPAQFRVMTSAGGLVRRSAYRPKDSLLSGPAGGVAGAAAVARRAGVERIITFDMGGTSTDVARVEGDFDYQYQHTVGPARVMAPALRVESVAAGGGSICRFDGSALTVGPDSAGARPGPACYGAGGPLTLTDVNLLLGRLDPARFGLPVSVAAAEDALAAVLACAAEVRGSRPSREQVLQGFLAIADERMAEAIRRISVREGYDPAEYTLVAFGGAGGLHACAVAERLGIRRVLHPADSGLLSAFGLDCAAEERIVERQVLRPLAEAAPDLPSWLIEAEGRARRDLEAVGIAEGQIVKRRAEAELRFAGQDAGVVVAAQPLDSLAGRFVEAYRRRFAYAPVDRAVEVVALRVVVSSLAPRHQREVFDPGSRMEAAAPGRAAFRVGEQIGGPAVVQDAFSTVRIAEGWRATVGSQGTLLVEAVSDHPADSRAARDELVDLELFTNRFRAMVDEMGQLLQRCALSVNIKERLDFSCALLDAGGELVANAPHVPVHLGALGLCVRRVAAVLELGPGDVAITNHPAFGGAHLPDVTLIAPVFGGAGERLGFVANRAHHAEIGGVRPGSMPPDARVLADEGVVLEPMYLVRGGEARWAEVADRLHVGPYPSRRVDENLADLHAQLASIRLGVEALGHVAARYGASSVRHYMARLKERAADALAEGLGAVPEGEVCAEDAMDDGSPVVVRVRRAEGRLRVDFTGSAAVHPRNLNATPAIVRSALIYVLRLMAGRELPLNEGLMRDVELVLPEGMLAPRFGDDHGRCPAVVGGNVETSQRIVDVLVRAFGLAASSQGTMNNVIFGNAGFSYYETIGGGTGAGNGFDGASGVHSHMTNTAITDPEILESRMPIRLERFALRNGSGGAGRFRGGEGVERIIQFLQTVDISLLTQRRGVGPAGAAGGRAGAPGEQWLDRAGGGRETLDAVSGTIAHAGDRLVIRTPGGGGWGA